MPLEAKCILEHRHEWTELANNDFKTTRPANRVVLHLVPQQDMFDDTLINDLTTHKNFPEGTILLYRWLGNTVTKRKSHGSMVINLNDKGIAEKIARGSSFPSFSVFKRTDLSKITFAMFLLPRRRPCSRQIFPHCTPQVFELRR